jgi:hypothetical protein
MLVAFWGKFPELSTGGRRGELYGCALRSIEDDFSKRMVLQDGGLHENFRRQDPETVF